MPPSDAAGRERPSASGQAHSKPARLQPAASLIVARRHPDHPDRYHILLGQRSWQASFMPGVFVAPGGRVEPADLEPDIPCPVPPVTLDKLMRRASGPMARGLVRASIREFAEETGILPAESVPLPQPAAPGPDSFWNRYDWTREQPPFARLDYIVRALTPTSRPRRFDTRFFLLCDPPILRRSMESDGELQAIDWYDFEQIEDLPMADITRLVLNETRHVLARRGRAFGRKALRILHVRGRRQSRYE